MSDKANDILKQIEKLVNENRDYENLSTQDFYLNLDNINLLADEYHQLTGRDVSMVKQGVYDMKDKEFEMWAVLINGVDSIELDDSWLDK